LLVSPLLGQRTERARLPAPAPAPIAHRVATRLELRAGFGSQLADTLERQLVREAPMAAQSQHLLDPLPVA
jgi:hypothetical protein